MNMLDDIMNRASEALARTDYLTCEARCLDALALARDEEEWDYYARILLPLQEARRQRRIIASEAGVRLGSASLTGRPQDWLERHDAGCFLLTRPHTAETASNLASLAWSEELYVEVLFADSRAEGDTWTVLATAGPAVTCELPAPPPAWRDRWLPAGEVPEPEAGSPLPPGETPVDWFIDATEKLGDAAIAQVTAPLGSPERVDQLSRMLDVVTDHEQLHQRLGEAARALR
ncbi:MAG: hypothetical protein ACLFVN_13395 [Phycisphaeraceae bacterium]